MNWKREAMGDKQKNGDTSPPKALEDATWEGRYSDCSEVERREDVIFCFTKDFLAHSPVSPACAADAMQKGYEFLKGVTGVDPTTKRGRTVVGIRNPSEDEGEECCAGWHEFGFDKPVSWINVPPSAIGSQGDKWGCEEGVQPLELFTHEVVHVFAKEAKLDESLKKHFGTDTPLLVDGTCDFLRSHVAEAMGLTALASAMKARVRYEIDGYLYWPHAAKLEQLAQEAGMDLGKPDEFESFIAMWFADAAGVLEKHWPSVGKRWQVEDEMLKIVSRVDECLAKHISPSELAFYLRVASEYRAHLQQGNPGFERLTNAVLFQTLRDAFGKTKVMMEFPRRPPVAKDTGPTGRAGLANDKLDFRVQCSDKRWAFIEIDMYDRLFDAKQAKDFCKLKEKVDASEKVVGIQAHADIYPQLDHKVHGFLESKCAQLRDDGYFAHFLPSTPRRRFARLAFCQANKK
jgi:hypothetical protein